MGIISWISSWFASTRDPEEPRWVRRAVTPPPARDDPKLDEIKRAAAADVEAMEKEKRAYFRPDGPGDIEDEL